MDDRIRYILRVYERRVRICVSHFSHHGDLRMKKENNHTFSIFDSVLEEVTADASPKIDVVNLTFESAV